MAIPHASSGEPIDVQPLGAMLPSAQTVALFKSDEVEVIRLVLLTGKSMKEHEAPGDITIQCIEGQLDITLEGSSRTLNAGQLLFVAAHARHSVTALAPSSALVTIVVKKP